MLLESLNPSARTMQWLRAAAYPAVFTLPAMLWLAGPVAARYVAPGDGWLNVTAWLPLFAVFGMLTVADYIVGRDVQNPNDAPPVLGNSFYRWLALLCLPVQVLIIWVSTAHAVAAVNAGQLNIIGFIGWFYSVGVFSGIVSINVAHELIHKDTALERTAGGLLLATVGYGTFKPEHVYGHHAWVATPYDQSSAPKGMNVYRFMFSSIPHNIAEGFRLEAQRLARRNLSAWSWRNECIHWTLATIIFAAACAWAFGWLGFVFFVAQSFIAICLLEAINYIEHYGLSRQTVEGQGIAGRPRYERVTPMHSWNSGYFLTNAMLLQLQRHSDHHANASRRYQDLLHHESSPQLPGGYGAMVMLALIPPLWKRVMDPRVPR